jgi:type I restriction enzyme M protein
MIDTYREHPKKPIGRYARRAEMAEIKKNDFNLNISRYISTSVAETEIVLKDTHRELVAIEKEIEKATKKHNAFLKELGLPPLP